MVEKRLAIAEAMAMERGDSVNWPTGIYLLSSSRLSARTVPAEEGMSVNTMDISGLQLAISILF
jgi:hypothetical protein